MPEVITLNSHAVLHSTSAALHHFKKGFPKLKWSTANEKMQSLSRRSMLVKDNSKLMLSVSLMLPGHFFFYIGTFSRPYIKEKSGMATRD